MTTKWVVTALAAGLGLVTTLPASAQRDHNPNMGHFYMARQQIQITDDNAQVNDMRTNPQPAQPGQAAAPAAMPRQALPRAGFSSYTSAMPVMNTSLPKVVNGVPPKAPAAPPPSNRVVIQGKKAKAQAYVAPRQTTPTTYSPYAGYGGGRTASAPPAGNYGGNSASTSVRGSLLHWRRSKSGGM